MGRGGTLPSPGTQRAPQQLPPGAVVLRYLSALGRPPARAAPHCSHSCVRAQGDGGCAAVCGNRGRCPSSPCPSEPPHSWLLALGRLTGLLGGAVEVRFWPRLRGEAAIYGPSHPRPRGSGAAWRFGAGHELWHGSPWCVQVSGVEGARGGERRAGQGGLCGVWRRAVGWRARCAPSWVLASR